MLRRREARAADRAPSVHVHRSGHGAWEASLTNLLSPGDTILVLESGYFSDEWAKMARALGLEVRPVAADWRHGVDIAGR